MTRSFGKKPVEPADPPYDRENDGDLVYADRRDFFLRELGFEPSEADALARTHQSKWYAKHLLVDLGCSRDLALKILL